MCGPRCITPFMSHQHLSQHTIPLCDTTFQIAPYRSRYGSRTRPHLALHPISHYVPHSMHSTPHFRSHHKWPHYAHHRRHHCHRISQAAPHVLHNCVIPPHLTVITPNSTSHYHVSRNIPHVRIPHILHPTTESQLA